MSDNGYPSVKELISAFKVSEKQFKATQSQRGPRPNAEQQKLICEKYNAKLDEFWLSCICEIGAIDKAKTLKILKGYKLNG